MTHLLSTFERETIGLARQDMRHDFSILSQRHSLAGMVFHLKLILFFWKAIKMLCKEDLFFPCVFEGQMDHDWLPGVNGVLFEMGDDLKPLNAPAHSIRARCTSRRFNRSRGCISDGE